MKKIAKGLVAATLLTTIVPGNISAKAAEENTQTEQLIINFKEDGSLSKAEKKSLNIETISTDEDSALIEVSVKDTENVIEKLEASNDVEFVSENTKYYLADEADTRLQVSGNAEKGTDTYFDKQWNLKVINSESAWGKMPKDATTVKVAVLDTGVSSTHEDLKNRVLSGATFLESTDNMKLTDSGVVGADGAEDKQGHGTFVSGIIAAEANNKVGIAGVAGEGNVQILPVKVMDNSGVGDAYHIAKGIDYAISQKVDVINMSLSGEYNEEIEAAVNRANDEGIVVVAASGNGGGNADASFPAALDHVISVGSVTEKDQAYVGSNEGSTVDLVAPGVNVVSTALAGDLGTSAEGRYTTGSGTSYAAPHVAAVAALYKAKNAEAKPAEVESALLKSAKDLGEEGHDNKTGYGRVDAAAALDDNLSKAKSTFTTPRKNANVIGTIPLEVAVIDTEIKQMEFFVNGKTTNKVVSVEDGKAIAELDTEAYEDGTYEITAKEVKALVAPTESTLAAPYEIKTTVNIRNKATSGYMFNVKAPNGSVAKGANVQLFEKTDGEYKSVWSGAADANGTARVPSNVGTDLKDLKVVVQGKFTPEGKEESAFIYSRDVSTTGTVELKSDSTVPVELATAGKKNKEIEAQYFVTLKDQAGISVNDMKLINSENGSKMTTLYADKGAYNLYAYAKDGSDTYFLSEVEKEIKEASSITFDAKEAGEVAIDNVDDALENAVLYLYNDDMDEALGSGGIATGANFYVTPGEYSYLVDAEVKGEEGEKNWVYILANEAGKKAVVKKGVKTAIQAGGQIIVSKFEGDQEAIKRYAKQRSVKYKEREGDMDAYKSDQAFYTTEVFSDKYKNELVGMHRGTLAGQIDAINKKDVNTGETSSAASDEEWQIVAKDFGDIYANFTVTRQANGPITKKILLDSNAKNATNPANRMYYMYSFFVMTSADFVTGKYDINLSMDKNPLMQDGINETIEMNLMDSGTTMELKDSDAKNVAAYIWLNRAEKTKDGDIEWTSFYTRNTDTTTKDLSIPNNLQTSELKNGNMAIIRYVKNGRYAYIYKQFDKIEELEESIDMPTNMTEVKITEVDGEKKLDNIGTKLLMFKKPVIVDDVETYVTVNNFQNYKYDSVYLEPSEDEYMIEGNYVSLSNGTEGKDNYYFLKSYKVEENKENTVTFDKAKLAKINIDTDAEGFSDVRGTIVYPYNKYTDSFITTLRTGKNFYVPADLEMNLQVQLGLGDTENNDKVWNYFMTKGHQTFQAGEQVSWSVGGKLSTQVKLTATTVKAGAELSGTTVIKDKYENELSSVIVNTTNDYSTAEEAGELAYKLRTDGQIIAVEQTTSDYSISHSAPATAANSVKPVISIVDTNDKVLSKMSSLSFYAHLHGVTAPANVGGYKLLMQIAGSPLGVTTSATNFTVQGSSVGGGNVTAPVNPTPVNPTPVTPTPVTPTPVNPTPVTPTPVTPTPTAPTTTGGLTDKGNTVSGTTTPNAIVTLEKNGVVIATTTADENGKYSLTFKKQKAGTSVDLVTTVGDQKASKTVVVGDATPPKVAISKQVSDKSNQIKLKVEADATVKLTVGGKTYTAKANKAGIVEFKVTNLKAGATWKAVATDAANNSTKVTGIVADKTAPKVSAINVTNQSKKVTVKTEKGAKITLKIGEKTYKKTANAGGNYVFSISKLKAGTKWSLVVEDKAGNKTTKTGQVKKQAVLKSVSVSKVVTTSSTAISGKVSKNSTVVMYKNGKKIKTVVASATGTFKFVIPKQKKNTVFSIVTKTSDGNTSKAIKVKVK